MLETFYFGFFFNEYYLLCILLHSLRDFDCGMCLYAACVHLRMWGFFCIQAHNARNDTSNPVIAGVCACVAII